ncbi:MoaD/ThiS family protein [Fusibacter paucivorans]|uniref:MoaD/ThiS family protein n=1 Tax=Fusibacter paucivorans TaxID=76009 RepID=A0ABS5PME8_9FIRM|nr:MoaD/ThiS family protein [Fusibacter paucivorans]MBS7526340.1 MoaD/ThiS family protein [Fusibacter paucivorans]
MTITVKLFATLRAYHDKIFDLTMPEAVTVEAVVKHLELPANDIAIIMINGRGAKMDAILEEGDVLALFPPVGGG